MTWPKERPQLTLEQQTVMGDWIEEFLTSIQSSRFGWVKRFDHTFPARSASSSARTLEIGAGAGSHLEHERVDDYVALEVSDELAAKIPRHDGVSVVVGDCESVLPWEDDSFDRVLAIHLLEHLYNLPAALDEVARVLRPEGVFSVVIPCEGGRLYTAGRAVTTKRMFEKRYHMPYEWMIRYDHCNTAHEVLGALNERFRVRRTTYFPFRYPSVDLNLMVGLELTCEADRDRPPSRHAEG